MAKHIHMTPQALGVKYLKSTSVICTHVYAGSCGSRADASATALITVLHTVSLSYAYFLLFIYSTLQEAARSGSKDAFARYTQLADANTRRCMLRGLLEVKVNGCVSVPLEEVEPASELVKRFCTGKMHMLFVSVLFCMGKYVFMCMKVDGCLSVPLEEVESASDLVKRFCTGKLQIDCKKKYAYVGFVSVLF